MEQKKVLFFFIDWFDPAYKGGGPIRSVTNLVLSLQQVYKIYVFTSDRDLGDNSPMAGIVADKWITYSKAAQVYYASPAKLSWKNIHLELKNIQPDCIYCNSMFSKYFTLYPLLMRRYGIVDGDLVLAPKGMLRKSALEFKPFKKKIFLQLFRLLGLHTFIRFHATDEDEKQSIERIFGRVKVYCILDSPAPLPANIVSLQKDAGAVKLLFIGRIHPIKQLDYLLNILMNQAGSIHLTIIGTVEDIPYWEKCRELMRLLQERIQVHYLGELPHAQLEAVINQHHVFTLPTKGENFGHAIYEALGAGRPVMISDQTPWKNLTVEKAGWDCPLENSALFSSAIYTALNWDQIAFDDWSKSAKNYVTRYFERTDQVAAYRQMFN